MELQIVSQQIKESQKQIQAIDAQLMELESTNMALNDLAGSKIKTEIFVPISSGVFAKAELKDNESLLVNVGAGTAVKKSIPDTISLVNEQITELEKIRRQAIEQLELMVAHAHEIEHKLQGLVSQGPEPAEHSCDEPGCRHKHQIK